MNKVIILANKAIRAKLIKQWNIWVTPIFGTKFTMKYQKNYYLLSPSFYNPPTFQDIKFVVLFWNMKPVWADFISFHKYCDRKYLPMLQTKNSILKNKTNNLRRKNQ